MTTADQVGQRLGERDGALALAAALPEIVTIDPDAIAARSGDAVSKALPGRGAIALARPRSTQEVVQVVLACRRLGIPIVPQGGLTGYAGGATPSPGSVALCLARMAAIEEIDLAGGTITVEAGATLQAVQTAATDAGMFFPVDLGSRGSCTIGGNVATNAGGNRVLRYGMMREAILGLEAVLPDGTILSSLNRLIKNNSGYDLKQLLVGSEGTLGIVTRVVCRMVPKPTSMCAAFCGLADYAAALRLLALARERLGTSLSAFEVMWPDFYELATSGQGANPPLAGRHGIYVLLDILGVDQAADEAVFENLLLEAASLGIVEDGVVSRSIAQAEGLWAIREAPAEFDRKLGRRLPFDIGIPTAAIGAFVEEAQAALRAGWPGRRSVFFGHVADGNVHIAVALDDGDTGEDAEDMIYAMVARRGGTISAEHGIGTIKRGKLSLSRNVEEINLMRRIKAMIDPDNAFNPGKLLP